MELNDLSHTIIGAACRVHSALGPGLLEHAYHLCLQHELISNGFKTLSEVKLPLIYKELNVEDAYRIDLLVEDTVIIEIKAVEQISHIHRVQLLTYLRLSKNP